MNEDKIIVALDTQSPAEIDRFIYELAGTATFVKVGMELYYTFGNDIIRKLKDNNFKIFLDLKLHDIPNTVHKSAKTLAKAGVDILNVHAAGGIEMMRAASEGFKEISSEAKLIGVTQLTSTCQETLNEEIGIQGELIDSVIQYAQNTKKAGLDGVVCSAHEVKLIKKQIDQNFLCITPGIRPKGHAAQDQKRVMTPTEAMLAGTDYMVIGRPITQADSLKTAFKDILQEIS